MTQESQYKNQYEKVKDLEEFVRGESCLSIYNNDYNGPGGTFTVIIKSLKGGIGSSIGLTLTDDTQLNLLYDIFRLLDEDKKEVGKVIRTPRESIFIGNTRKRKNEYLIEISKINITSSGRSRHGLFITILEDDIKKIHNSILDAMKPLEKKRQR